MRFCPECGSPIEAGMRFCGECGYRVPAEEMKEVTVSAPAEQPAAPTGFYAPGDIGAVEEVVIPAPVEVPVVEEVIAPEPVEAPAVEEAPAGAVCPKCGAVNEPGDRFCLECGCDMTAAVAPAKVFCPECGTANAPTDAFCCSCGTALAAPVVSAVKETAKKSAKKAKKLADKGAKSAKALADKGVKAAKKLPKPVLLAAIALAAVAVVLILLAIFGVFSGSKGGDNYGLYIKDEEVFFTAFKKDDVRQITEQLVDTDDVDNDELYDSRLVIGDYITVVDGGKRIFFPDRIDGQEITICYRDSGKNSEAEKLDSGIVLYAVNEKGNAAVYLKDDGKLYRSDLKEKEKIANDVLRFYVTQDLRTVMFLTEDEDLYVQTGKGDKEKVAGDVTSVEYVDEALENVVYIRDGDLYRQQVGKDREKIASDVQNVIAVYEDGTFYFTTCESETKPLSDYVKDDMADVDAAITEPGWDVQWPEYPDYPSYYYFDSDEEYEKAVEEYEQALITYEEECQRMQQELDLAWEEYYAMCEREDIRESLERETYVTESYTLHFFDGKQAVEMMAGLPEPWGESVASQAAVGLFCAGGEAADVQVLMSELEGTWQLSEKLEEARSKNYTYYLTKGAQFSALDMEELDNGILNKDGSMLYYMTDRNEKKDEASLYTAPVKGTGLGKAELLDEDVSVLNLLVLDDGSCVYFKDVSDRNYQGEMYIDGQEMDEDVNIYKVQIWKDLGVVTYYVDYDYEDGGQLKLLKGKKAEEVAEDVWEYTIAPGGQLWYVAEYNERKCEGEIHAFGGKKTMLDEEVVTMLTIVHEPGEICGYYYYW